MAKNNIFELKIFVRINLLKKYTIPVISVLVSCCPVKVGKSTLAKLDKDIFQKELTFVSKSLVSDLNIETVTNFRGGIITRFDSLSVQKLKKKIMRPESKISYTFPIKDISDVYTEPFGAFMAKRPNGRPHLGLDIFTTKFAKKPKKPITIISPIDGIVISNKHAHAQDNIISNSITILGVDGRRYAFDHMARGTDYPDSIKMPEVGTEIVKGTPLGYIGKTGETVMWHLHLCVMTDEQLAKQLNDKNWLKIAANSPYSELRGPVNPRDKKEAGPIADILNEILK